MPIAHQRRNALKWIAATAASTPLSAMARAVRAAPDGGADILVGQVAPFSGPQAHYGRALAVGINAKFSAFNAAGGVRGRKLRLLTADDQFDPGKTIAAYQSLADQGVVAFVGNFGTPTTLAALPWIARHGIPVVGVYSGAQAFRDPVNPDIFNLRGSLVDEATAIRKLLAPQEIDRIAVIAESDAYGLAGLHAIQSVYGASVPSSNLAVGANAAQVGQAVAQVMRSRPQVIVLVLTTNIAAAAVRAIHAAGFSGVRQQIVALSGVGPGEFAARLPEQDRAGVLVSTIVPFPWMSEFVARGLTLAYKADQIGFSSMEGYIDAAVFARALGASADATPQGIQSALNALGSFDLGDGYPMRITGRDHQATHYANVVYIRPNGTFMGN